MSLSLPKIIKINITLESGDSEAFDTKAASETFNSALFCADGNNCGFWSIFCYSSSHKPTSSENNNNRTVNLEADLHCRRTQSLDRFQLFGIVHCGPEGLLVIKAKLRFSTYLRHDSDALNRE